MSTEIKRKSGHSRTLWNKGRLIGHNQTSGRPFEHVFTAQTLAT
jgi:hypothetical protein